jgi:hypothetical protein
LKRGKTWTAGTKPGQDQAWSDRVVWLVIEP